jgi:hypothetical protein
MMPQGMKKTLQSMRCLQTTKHKTQGKYQSVGAHTSYSINKSKQSTYFPNVVDAIF